MAPNRERGMTLIELMTVVAVVAIVASLAVSGYRGVTMRANRTEGRNALMRIQMAQEKFFLQNNTYTTDLTSAPPTGLGLGSTTTATGLYTLSVAAGATGSIATSYVATATAAAGQTSDVAACQVFTLSDQNQRSPADSTGCWK
jgi:type IV pilus assembly protein PilE